MRYREFENIEIPKPIEGWDDHSWHNDATAHSQLPLPDGSGIVFWVSHDDVSLREYCTMSKYLVEHQPNLNEWVEENREILYDGDDLGAAMSAVWATINLYLSSKVRP